MALVERQADGELLVVAGDDRRALAEAGVEDGLHAGGVLDVGELRGHVGVGGAVALVGDDLDAVLADHLEALLAHRGAEAVGAGDHADLGDALRLHVLEDLLAGHAVGVRGLEHPLLDRVDDLDGAGERDERDLGVLGGRDDRHGGAGGGAADDRDDLVVLDQAGGEGARLVRVAAVVVERQRDLLAVDAAGGVQLLDQHPQGLRLRVAEEGGGAGLGDRGAEADLGARRSGEAEGGEGGERSGGQGLHWVSSPWVF